MLPQGDGRWASRASLLACFTALLSIATTTSAAATAPLSNASDAATVSNQTANTLEQFCINDALTRVNRLRRPTMRNPGSRHGRNQIVILRGWFDGLASQCQGKYHTIYQSQAQIRRRVGKPGKKVARWLTMDSGYDGWGLLYSRDAGGWGIYEEEPGGHNDPPWYFNRGGRFPVRVKTRVKVVRNELQRTPVKGQPGLFNESRPTVALKLVSVMRAKVPRKRFP